MCGTLHRGSVGGMREVCVRSGATQLREGTLHTAQRHQPNAHPYSLTHTRESPPQLWVSHDIHDGFVIDCFLGLVVVVDDVSYINNYYH